MLKISKILISALISIVLSAQSAHAGDAAPGKMIAMQQCQTCHGMDGVAIIATAPNISGQQIDYLKIQLEAYRDKKREHVQMSIIASMLSDEDIENVAAWYSSIRVIVEPPDA